MLAHEKVVVVFFVFAFINKTIAQSWVSSGAVWSYSLKQQIPCLDAYREARFTGTVSIHGRICDKITSSVYGYFGFQCSNSISNLLGQMQEDIFTFSDNNVIYLISPTGSFDTLVDFNAIPGATWYSLYKWNYSPNSDPTFTNQPTKNTVVDTGHTTINGVALKTLTVSPLGIIVERIGNLSAYFYHWYCLDVDCWPSPVFSCYWDDNFALYNRSAYCNYNLTGIKKNDGEESSLIYPNPVFDFLKINVEDKCFIQIFNTSGQLVRDAIFEGSGEKNIDLSALPTGVYTLELKFKNAVYRQKLSKL